MPPQTTVNRIVFIKRHYRTLEDLYTRVSDQVRLLMETGYVCVIFEVNVAEGAVIIEFNPNAKNEELQHPYWLFPDEIEHLSAYQREVEIEEHKDALSELEAELEEEEEEDIIESLIKPKKNKKGDA